MFDRKLRISTGLLASSRLAACYDLHLSFFPFLHSEVLGELKRGWGERIRMETLIVPIYGFDSYTYCLSLRLPMML